MTLMGSWGEKGGENDQETVLSKFWISTTLLAPSMDAERESRWRLTPFRLLHYSNLSREECQGEF